jgi:hypothetical protein
VRPPKRPLLDDLQILVHSVVRDARRRRKLPDGTVVVPEILDRVRAAEIGMKFLERQQGLTPPDGTSEFEQSLAAYHGARGRGAPRPNGEDHPSLDPDDAAAADAAADSSDPA